MGIKYGTDRCEIGNFKHSALIQALLSDVCCFFPPVMEV